MVKPEKRWVLYGDLTERSKSIALSVDKDQAKETSQLVDKVGTRSKKYRLVINKLVF